MVKFTTNMRATSSTTHGLAEGETLKITAIGAVVISGGLYKNGALQIPFQKTGDNVSIKLAFKGRSLKGKCTLKIRAYDAKHKGFGQDDNKVEII